MKNDFESTEQTAHKSAIYDSKRLMRLSPTIDEHVTLQAQRKTSQNHGYEIRTEELESLDDSSVVQV